MTPRDYQQQAIDAVIAEFQTADRAQIHMAPGSGKTYVAHCIRTQGKHKRVVFAAPSIHLVHQSIKAWTSYSAGKLKAVAVCSGKLSVADKDAIKELGSIGVIVTTNRNVIAKRLNQGYAVFTTYKSARKVANAKVNVDLLIADEAHHTAGDKNKRAGIVLDNNAFPATKRLFMTATPVISNDTGMMSMEDTKVYGNVAYTLTFREAVDRKILADYKVVISVVDENVDKQSIALIATSKAIKELGVKKGLTFHSKVKSAVAFQKAIVKVHRQLYGEDLRAYHLNASHSSDERSAVLNKLTNNTEPTLITNVKILGEGFDYNDLDFISLIDPKSSVVDIVQNIGRVMRRNGVDKVGTVIVPVGVNKAGNVHHTSHKTIFKVATALKSYDSMLTSKATKRVSNADVKNFVAKHVNVVIDNSSNSLEMADKIKLETVEFFNVDGKTDWCLSQLKEFCEKHDRLPRSTPNKGEKSNIAERNLRSWVTQNACRKTPLGKQVRAIREAYAMRRPAKIVDRLREFMRIYKRRPSGRSQGRKSTFETRLYICCYCALRSKTSKSESTRWELRTLWNSITNGKEIIWQNRKQKSLERLVTFIKNNGRLPIGSTASKEETALYATKRRIALRGESSSLNAALKQNGINIVV